MKKVLIISPHFPPVNAPDMHRVRQSLPFFKKFGWSPVVITVDSYHVETKQDILLSETIPKDIEVIKVKAFSTKYTRKIGLGSLALRSIWFYFKTVNRLLIQRQFDLIYFSTTMFPLPILGRIWKKKYGIPYIIDMQDPWFSNYYLFKPKNERPPKFWFSYNLNKYTEPYAMKKADGIISVSEEYNKTLQERYKNITPKKCVTITFGAFEKDFEVLENRRVTNRFFKKNDGLIHIPYVGAVGHIMQYSISCIMKSLVIGNQENKELFKKIRLYFIGTSYAPDGKGKETVMPIAEKFGVQDQVIEYTNRIPYFEALKLLKDANMLIVPGSDDPNYTASKLYNYIISRKPIITVFNEGSSVNTILQSIGYKNIVTFNKTEHLDKTTMILHKAWLEILMTLPYEQEINQDVFERYTAKLLTKQQTKHFERCLNLL